MNNVLVIIEPKRSYERQLLEGILKYSKSNSDMVCHTLPPYYLSQKESQNVLQYIKDFNPDGIIIRESSYLEEVKKMGIPTIISPYKSIQKGYCNIVSDDKKVSEIVAETFINSGLSNFAYIGIKGYFWSEKRFEEYEKKLQVIPKQLALKGSWNSYAKQITSFISKLDFPIGIYCANDEIAKLTLSLAYDAKIEIPEEISIIGVDNDSLICELSKPTISSIDHDAISSGYRAAQKMNNLLNGDIDSSELIYGKNVRLVIRESSDSLYSKDELFNKAVALIIEDASSNCITVNYLAKELGCSRRKLERVFAKHIKVSIKRLIDDQKIKLIKELLINSNLNVDEIAFKVGFQGQENLSRFFKRLVKMNPSEFRRNNKLY